MNDKWLTINFERYGRDKKDRYALENIRLCLVTHAKPEQVIDIRLVYTYSEGKVVVALPELKPGEYRPAVILKGDEKKVYVLPMRWVVRGRWRR